MIKTTKLRNLILFTFVIAFFQSRSDSQKMAGIEPGVVLLKFAPGQLKADKEQLDTTDIASVHIKKLLRNYGFRGGKKIFKNARSGDTVAFSKNGERVKLIDLSAWYMIKIADTANLGQTISALKKIPEVIAVSVSRAIPVLDNGPNDPKFQDGSQWGLNNHTSPGHDIHALQAWEFNKGRNDVAVAVIDGGINYNHPDLDPGDRSRVIQGYDASDGDNDPNDDIASGFHYAGHGTKVAGVIGAITNNNSKIAGIMWNCKLMPIKIAKTVGIDIAPFNWLAGTAFDWWLADGINYASSHQADVINMSIGGPGPGCIFIVSRLSQTKAHRIPTQRK